MDPSTAIYESILNNDICGARETLRRYLREHGLLDAPALPIEHCLAVYKTLGECGLGRLAAGAVRAMACHPDAHIWQRLLYYWGLRGSLGFLVTLELLDQLESRITGEEGRRAPLRDLLLRPSSAAGQSHPFVSRRERRVLQDLASRPVRFLPAEKSLFGFAFVCLRACLYASGYWQRTAQEQLERARCELDAVWPELVQQPLLASLLLRQIVAGYAQLRHWDCCEALLQRLVELPGSRIEWLTWKVYLSDCRGQREDGRR